MCVSYTPDATARRLSSSRAYGSVLSEDGGLLLKTTSIDSIARRTPRHTAFEPAWALP